MRISTSSEQLLKTLQKLSKGTPTRSTLPILSCVLFEAEVDNVSLRTTDLEITINCKLEASIERPGSAAIPLQTLMDITNEMPDSRITISVDEGQRVELITNTGTYDLMGKPKEEFPPLPEVDNRKASGIEANVLKEIIRTTAFAISKDELKPALTGVLFRFEEKKDNETAEIGDLVIFDYKATINENVFEGGEGKNTQIVLGKDLFIKGFDKDLIGAQKNKDKIVYAILPENYPNKKYSNQKAKFTCKILTIKKPIDTKIDNQFAKNLGAKDLNDLKKLVSKQIADQYKQSLFTITKKEILYQIEKFKDIDIPDSLIAQEIEIISQGMNKEEKEKQKKDHEQLAKKRIKTGLILNEFGEQNNLKVNEEEIKNEIQKQIKMMPGQEKMLMEYYQKNPSAVSSLRGGIYEDKIISLIKENVKSEKKSISISEAEKIIVEKSKEENKKIDVKQKKESPKSKKNPLKSKSKLKKVSKK